MEAVKRKSSLKGRKRKKIIFYSLMMAWPVAQFAVFYLGVNVNSILLAFKEYRYAIDGATVTGYIWSGFKNFTDSWLTLTGPDLRMAYKISLLAFAVSVFVAMPVCLFCAYFVYKKQVGHGFFKVALFVPSVIPSLVMTMIFLYFVEDAIPGFSRQVLQREMKGLLWNLDTSLGTLLFYSVWGGFGTTMLMYLGAMNSIDDSVIESANLDGARGIKEFWYIVLPLIYPTFVTFFVVNVAGLFANQLSLHAFYGRNADYSVYTFGYYLFRETAHGRPGDYPLLAATGLIMTVFIVPVTLLARYLLEKFGPKCD